MVCQGRLGVRGRAAPAIISPRDDWITVQRREMRSKATPRDELRRSSAYKLQSGITLTCRVILAMLAVPASVATSEEEARDNERQRPAPAIGRRQSRPKWLRLSEGPVGTVRILEHEC